MAVIEEGSGVAQLLRSVPLAWLTTVRPDGQPQSSYVWLHFDGHDLLVFSERQAAKVRNVEANPRVSFHLDGDGQGGRVLTIDASARVVDLGADAGRVDAYLRKYDEPIRVQLNTTPDELRARFSTALRVVPGRVRTW